MGALDGYVVYQTDGEIEPIFTINFQQATINFILNLVIGAILVLSPLITWILVEDREKISLAGMAMLPAPYHFLPLTLWTVSILAILHLLLKKWRPAFIIALVSAITCLLIDLLFFYLIRQDGDQAGAGIFIHLTATILILFACTRTVIQSTLRKRKKLIGRLPWFMTAVLGFIVLTVFLINLVGHSTTSTNEGSTLYEMAGIWPEEENHFQMGQPTGLDLNSKGELVVFHRARRKWSYLRNMPRLPIDQPTILVLDTATGKVLRSWGSGIFIMPHGLAIDHDDHVWITDVGLHQVFKFSAKGELLLTLGEKGKPGSDTMHFNQPTDLAFAPDGSFYVSDGYGNSRIMKFSPEGRFLFQWGKKGKGNGEFDIPHSLDLDSGGNVYVADRGNHRVQAFTAAGKFLQQWTREGWGEICSVKIEPGGKRMFVTDDAVSFGIFHPGSRIFEVNLLQQSNRVSLLATVQEKTWFHDFVLDQEGKIYSGDIATNRIFKFKPHKIRN
jgi:peptidylamidoglycolate lyase